MSEQHDGSLHFVTRVDDDGSIKIPADPRIRMGVTYDIKARLATDAADDTRWATVTMRPRKADAGHAGGSDEE